MNIPGDLTGPEQRVLVSILRQLEHDIVRRIDLPERYRPDRMDPFVSLCEKLLRGALRLEWLAQTDGIRR